MLVLTWNEAGNIGRCLRSVAWSDDVVVFDSHSTDGTAAIAEALGARVVRHRFVDYGTQREAARTRVAFAHPWVFTLDADEECTPALAAEIRRAVRDAPGDVAAFMMRRRDWFRGRWIRRSTLYPTWFVRLFRRERARWDGRAVHERLIVDGRIARLRGHLVHRNFSKGVGDWWRRHRRYAALEAREAARELRGPLDLPGLVAADPFRRRRALKRLAYRLPGRPHLRFWYTYLLRGGFLDGARGRVYCRFIRAYERLIHANMLAMEHDRAPAG